MFDDVMQKLDKLEPLLEIVGDKQLTAGAKFLAERIGNPNSYVTFLGETSSGKSSLINGLLGRVMLPVKACPTTGAITEVELCPQQREDYYAINKNATIERLAKEDFIQLSEHPDSELQRVKLCITSPAAYLNNMRIFDTPGYGSIIVEHEEILKEFLPNSDVVIYTVSYKIGIQEDDYIFLGFLKELVREDAEIVLVVNCCPASASPKDRRISEIFKYVSGVLCSEPKLFCIPVIHSSDDNEYPLPAAEDLWRYVSSVVNSEEHKKLLHDSFEDLVNDLYKSCDSVIGLRYAQSCIDRENLNFLLEQQKKSAQKIRSAIPELIEPTFDRIISRLPELLDRAAENAAARVQAEIDSASAGKMDEMTGFVNSHLLPFAIKQENNEISRYLEIELSDLNEKVDDYINKEVQDFTSTVSIRLNTYTETAVKNVSGRLISNLATNGLKNVFAGFGGAGGANAGIANAASHLLKKIGNLFGKTFSRDTHNALKHFLARIGATSMKAVGAAITVVMELLMLAIDYGTWKPKLKKKVAQGVKSWKEETLLAAIKDIKALRQENIDNIMEIAANFEACFSDEEKEDSSILKSRTELSERIGREIGAI